VDVFLGHSVDLLLTLTLTDIKWLECLSTLPPHPIHELGALAGQRVDVTIAPCSQ